MTALPDLSGQYDSSVPLPTQYPAIPEPTQDPAALQLSVQRLKEAVELLTGQRTQRLAGMNQAVFELRSKSGNLSAMIRQVDEVSTAMGVALAQRTTTLEADNDATQARITKVDTARADGDTALASSITTLQTKLDTTNATVQTVDQARVDGDNALATHLNTVEAVSNAGTANGAISLSAQSGLDGVSAAFSWNIKATAQSGTVQAGMWATVDSAGYGNIMFLTDRFRIYKPGGAVPVFDYYKTGFTFNGNVLINGNLVVTGTINTDQIATNAVSQIASSGATMSTVIGMNCRGGTYYVLAIYDGSATRYQLGTVVPGNLILTMDGVNIGNLAVSYEVSGNSPVSVAVLATPIARTFGLSAGNHTFGAYCDGSVQAPVTLIVIEYLR